MKNVKVILIIFMCYFVINVNAEVVVSEDFEGGTIGQNLSSDGWSALYALDINNLVCDNALISGFGKSAKVVNGGIQAVKSFSNTIADTDEDIYAKFIVTRGNQNIRLGFKSGNSFGFSLSMNSDGAIVFEPANGATTIESSGNYLINDNTTYEFIVQMKNIDHGNSGSVKVRNISAGEIEYTALEDLQDISMNFSHTSDKAKPSNLDVMWVRGQYNGWYDYIELGTGVEPKPSPVVASEDFEGGVVGDYLTSDGWYMLWGQPEANIQFAESGLLGYGISSLYRSGGAQAKKDFANIVTDHAPDLYAKFVVHFGSQNMKFGFRGEGNPGGPGFYLDVMPEGDIKLTAANGGMTHVSTDDYQISTWTAYEFVVNFTNINDGNKGWVKVRNIFEGEHKYTELEGLQNVDMNFVHSEVKPSNFGGFYIRGQYQGKMEYIEYGFGVAPFEEKEDVVWAQEDFEDAAIGNYLGDEGWEGLYTTSVQEWYIDTGDNGTLSAFCDYSQPPGQWGKTFADPNEFEALGEEMDIFFEVDLFPRKLGDTANNLVAGVRSIYLDDVGRPAFHVGFRQNETDNSKWDIYFHNAVTMGPGYPNMEWTNSDFEIYQSNIYSFRVQMHHKTNHGYSGSVYFKNLTLNEHCWTPIPNMQGLPMQFDFESRPEFFRQWYLRGSDSRSQVDNFRLGTGLLTECDVYCDPSLSGLSGDLNGDCYVNIDDLDIIASNWLQSAPANLIENGDFSQVDAVTGLPVGWNYITWAGGDDPTGELYAQVVDGQLVQMMEKGIPSDNFGVYQVFEVIPGRDYTINADWSGSVVDNGWAEILLYSVNTPTPDINDLTTPLAQGNIVAKHGGMGDPNPAFGPEPITDAMYHEHCLFDPINGGTNVRTARAPYMVVRTNLGSITPDGPGGIHELYIDNITVTGPVPGDADEDDDVNILDYSEIADEWLTEAMGPY